MALNLKKNEKDLLKSWDEFIKVHKAGKWVCYGYEAKTFNLQTVGSGDGGIDDFLEELSDGLIMYGGVCVKDPNTELPKIVFIVWQGLGVPEQVRGKCATHSDTVSAFFKGFHVCIVGRSQDDINEAAIVDKVKKSSGANYSVHKEVKKESDAPTHLVNSYVKVDPKKDIEASGAAKFWEKNKPMPEKPNERPSEARAKEAAALQASKEKLLSDIEREKREKEDEIENLRKQRQTEISSTISSKGFVDEEKSLPQKQVSHDRAQEASDLVAGKTKSFKNMFEQQSYATRPKVEPKKIIIPTSNIIEEEKESHPPESSKDRAQEVKDLVGGKTTNFKNMFEQQSYATRPKVEPKKIVIPTSNIVEKEKESHQPESSKDRAQEVKDLVGGKTKNFKNMFEQQSQPEPSPVIKSTAGKKKWQPPAASISSEPNQVQQMQDKIQSTLFKQPPAESTNEREIQNENSYEENSQPSTKNEQPEEEPAPVSNVKKLSGSLQNVLKIKTLNVVGLYQYDPSDDTEIGFVEGELIYDVTKEDPDWWSGTKENGRRGLFPNNFVAEEGTQEANDAIHNRKLAKESSTHTETEVHEEPEEMQEEIQPETVQIEEEELPTATVLYDYEAAEPEELTITENEVVFILEKRDDGWWLAKNKKGKTGVVPSNFLDA